MGIISSLREKRSTSNISSPESWFSALFGGGQAYTGKSVNADSALTSTAVYACVRILSETVASLPLPVYERLAPKGKVRANKHHLYSVLHDKANSEMTSFTFRETLMNHLLLWGNAYAEIERDGGGRVRGLWPLDPSKTYPERQNGKLIYKTSLPNGQNIILPRERVFHVAGLGFDGLVGYNPIRLAREAIGLSLASEEYGARFFGNGAKPSGVLEHPHSLSEPASKNLRTSWNEMHQGLSNQHRIAILEEGMSYKQIGIAPEEAQFLETRKFQVTEIARFFRVPPHMLADLERATFSNIEQQSIDFVTHSIRPWLVRLEQAINQQLFGASSGDKYFSEFVVDALLRGDIKSRYDAYSVAIQNGFMNRNEVREKENLNPSEGLDEYLVPLNMVTTSQMDNMQQVPPPTDERSVKKKETRQRVSVETRSAITNSYKIQFKNALNDIINQESRDVLSEAKKQLRNSAIFSAWLNDYYKEHDQFINNKMFPVLMNLMRAMNEEAAKELDKKSGLTKDLQEFVRNYLSAFTNRWIGNSINSIRDLMSNKLEENEDPFDSLEDRFNEWEKERVDSIAQEEAVRASNAFVKASYVAFSVTQIRWVADGESCPICESLDGQVVGIESSFVRQGQDFNIGSETPFTPSRDIGHAPAHRGCECTIIAD